MIGIIHIDHYVLIVNLLTYLKRFRKSKISLVLMRKLR
jgi:hypothetical protein